MAANPNLQYFRKYLWVMKDGELCEQFPPEAVPVDESRLKKAVPYPLADEVFV